MATKQTTADYIMAQIDGLPDVRCRKMFGEYAVYCDEKVVALICDDTLFMKMTEAGLDFVNDPIGASPYPGAKNYIPVSNEKLGDSEWLCEFVQRTADVLPKPKPKRKK